MSHQGEGSGEQRANYKPHVLAAALTPHWSGTDRGGSMAVVTLLPVEPLPRQLQGLPFSPPLWLQSLPVLQANLKDTLAHQEWLLYHLPDGYRSHEPQEQPQPFRLWLQVHLWELGYPYPGVNGL